MREGVTFFSAALLLFGLVLVSRAAAAPAGQKATCGTGPQHRTFNLTVAEKVMEIGQGLKAEMWSFSGTVPAPTIEVCEGDTVKIVMKNDGTMAHGLDSHAFRINAAQFGPVQEGKTLTFERRLDTPGVFMYHCAAGPVTDQHIKMGMYGVMIVYPRKLVLRPARELVVTEAGIYGEPDNNGLISPSSAQMEKNQPSLVAFNGRVDHEPVAVKAGELIRVYFVHVGPGSASFHVIGTILDRAHESGNPRNVIYGVQSYAVPAGSGAMFEFTTSGPGSFLLVDHNLLSQVPNGLVIPFASK